MKKYLTYKNLGWIFAALVVVMLGVPAISKVIGTQEMINNFEFMKLQSYRVIIGLTEIASLGLLIYPKTSRYGAILIGCFMSGALSLHLALMGGNMIMIPILIMVFAWFSHYLRTHKISF